MANVKKLKDRTVPVTVTIDGEDVNMRVRLHAITPAQEREVYEAERSGDPKQVQLICEHFCRFIASWDLELEEGVPLPLEPEVIMEELPSTLLVGIFAQAKEAASPLAS